MLEKERRSFCLTNLRQLGLVNHAYTVYFNGVWLYPDTR